MWRHLPILALLAACHRGEKPMNIVVVMTDDQRQDTLWAMPIVEERLGAAGVTYVNARVSTPMCCPSRASILAGGFYAKDTGVLTNEPPNGGAERFDEDADSLASRMAKKGYTNALIGKYLNGYDGTYIPEGWSTFVSPVEDAGYDNWRMVASVDGGEPEQIEADGYLTDREGERAVAFVQSAEEPFFLYLTPLAPHFPATPAPGDEELFPGYTLRNDAYNETNVQDKPRWLQEDYAVLTEPQIATHDEAARDELRTLASVDRWVGSLLDALTERDVLDRTVVIFLSDNGKLWGEHRLFDKGLPYEPAVRVPLVILAPGLAPGTDEGLVVANLDVPATIMAVADIRSASGGFDLLAGPVRRDMMLMEGYTIDRPIWSSVTDGRWKYTQYANNEEELYDLDRDPEELESVLDAPNAPVASLRAFLDANRGLAVLDASFPDGGVGRAYEHTIVPSGGVAPYHFAALDIPDGFTLNDDGVLSGTPENAELHLVRIEVTDSSRSPWDRAAQRFVIEGPLVIGAPTSVEADIEPLPGRRARVTLRSEVPAEVRVRWGGEPDFDLTGHVLTVRVEGERTVEIGPVPDRTWFWRIEPGGLPGPVREVAGSSP